MTWYEIVNIDTVDSPALVVYPSRVRDNIRKAIAMAGDAKRLRPHVKTHKMIEVCRMMIEEGIDKFKCATIAEAEMLALAGAPDVLLAHQPTGPKPARLLQLVTQYPTTDFSCIVDNAATAQTIAAIFSGASRTASVFIDVNNGMKRSGVAVEQALPLFKEISSLHGLRVIGIHAYDGHIRDTDPDLRKEKSDQAFEPVERLLRAISEIGPRELQVVAGGSPSFPTHTQRPGVQYSPGTFVFWDWGYKEQLPDEPFEYAALVITRVISVLDPHTICVDLGHKAVAAENPLPRVCFLGTEGTRQIGQSEEHLVLQVPNASVYRVGDVLYGAPYHICPTVALYDQAVTVRDHIADGEWKVAARGRKIHF